jgi:CheY-like chemotaxis protein
MSGEIGAESRDGGGSTFWFTADLPEVARVASFLSQPAPRADPPKLQAKATQAPQGPLVLVAEDNEINRAVAKALLAKRGLRTEVAHNGLEAVQMAVAKDYAAILMDCQMPELDGYEATRRIRAAENGHVPIIAMTAHSMKGDRERCLAAGMDDYLSKPVRNDQLDEAIKRWLSDYEPGAHAHDGGNGGGVEGASVPRPALGKGLA